jgi:hypothetical protein
VATEPSAFACPWVACEWISDSIKEKDPLPCFITGADLTLWLTAERTLAYWMHLDFIRHKYGLGATGKGFELYNQRAYDGLYTAHLPSGILSPELVGELWYVRRNKTKTWDKPGSMNLGTWMTINSVPPHIRLFLTHVVAAIGSKRNLGPTHSRDTRGS